MSKPNPIPKGMLFTVSTGCYSDYSVMGVFRALQDIDTAALQAEYLKEHPDENKDYNFDYQAFFEGVVRRGLIEAVPSWEWHLADYSSPDEMHISEA